MALKTCVKCGHQAEVDDTPFAACPACGVIYAKAVARPATPAKQSQRDGGGIVITDIRLSRSRWVMIMLQFWLATTLANALIFGTIGLVYLLYMKATH